jgi:signal transduction histidine kinase
MFFITLFISNELHHVGKDHPMKESMKQNNRTDTILSRIHTIPLLLLGLSTRERLLIVILSYILGIPSIWYVFPMLHNAASMILPLICTCWLFRYRGLLISMFSTVVTIWLVVHFFAGDIPLGQPSIARIIIGFVIMLWLGLTICWLRTAIDLVYTTRQQALIVEQKRLQAAIAYEQQCKINDLKDQFLLNVSHELRTPLTVLGGSLELLKEFHEYLDPLERAQALTQALASQKTLVDLVNQVLDTTTMVSEFPSARPEAISMHQQIQQVLAQQDADEVAAYRICLHVPDEIMVWADPHLLAQVLENLLTNIFKYVSPKTEIHIETTQETPSSPVYIAIQDAGPGIPVEEQPLLFEKFVRLKRDLAGTTRGTGLGLYICKQLVEAMKGCIWVESSGRPGEGSRFCITLPPCSSNEHQPLSDAQAFP